MTKTAQVRQLAEARTQERIAQGKSRAQEALNDLKSIKMGQAESLGLTESTAKSLNARLEAMEVQLAEALVQKPRLSVKVQSPQIPRRQLLVLALSVALPTASLTALLVSLVA